MCNYNLQRNDDKETKTIIVSLVIITSVNQITDQLIIGN